VQLVTYAPHFISTTVLVGMLMTVLNPRSGIYGTVSIVLILSAGGILSVGFEKVYLMQNTINQAASEVISTYVYKIGLTGTTDFSYSTAIGLFNSIVNMVMLLAVNFVTGRLSKTSLF
jgi:putative aldouronate transport system permease protein